MYRAKHSDPFKVPAKDKVHGFICRRGMRRMFR